MSTVLNYLTDLVSVAFEKHNYSADYGQVLVSKTDFCQYQCNGALSAAKKYKTNPFQIAEKVIAELKSNLIFKDVIVARPGFININLSDEFIVDYCNNMLQDSKIGIEPTKFPSNIIIDYGGPNVAKPLHVGHLRSAIIGESLKRLAKILGHKVIGDVHLGDWGLQMGMIIAYLKKQNPNLIFFQHDYSENTASKSPVSIEELEFVYPQASSLAKSDDEFMLQARNATYELQNGKTGYVALWKHIVNVSVKDLKENYKKLNVSFDLWEGESDSHKYITPMIDTLKLQGFAFESQGALVIDVSEQDDKTEIPPLILTKSDGAVLYSTTDLATIKNRVAEYNPTIILYVVDKRQANHFKQVFRAAYKTGIAPENISMEHIAFGTMNGKDGKPFKTRDGGVMKLSVLIESLIDEAKSRMESVTTSIIASESEREDVAKLVGIAALKFGDLINVRTSDYIFDIEKFSSFEGKTGPYLLYSVVRIKSILRKANDSGYSWERISQIESDIERNLLLKIMEIQDMLLSAFENRYPSIIAEYLYSLSNLYNSFYHAHHIINEKNEEKRNSRLAIISLTQKTMEICLDLLGIEIPDRM